MGVEADPGEAAREGARIFGEQRRPVGVLETADPVRHAEVTQIGDGRDLQPVQLGEGLVGKFPVVPARTRVRRVVRRPVAQIAKAERAHQVEILLPALVVTRLRHLVDAQIVAITPTHDRVAVLDAGGEQEIVRLMVLVVRFERPRFHRLVIVVQLAFQPRPAPGGLVRSATFWRPSESS
jgi:hypothetical protein